MVEVYITEGLKNMEGNHFRVSLKIKIIIKFFFNSTFQNSVSVLKKVNVNVPISVL